ncbi:MAG: hypothetical protein J5I99_06970 [Verrucomicrobia bacterium]|nr:hypothetical protein [Kiritimatiellia bacterium]MCO6400950.1 hypothetical protein [Verrucomicrobiota bacterium]
MSAKLNTVDDAEQSAGKGLAVVGSVLTIAAGLSFFVVCMLLPLVGKAGVQTVHAQENFFAFLTALLISLLFSLAATAVKMARRRQDQSPMPYLSILLTGLNILLLISLLAGLLKI